MDLAVNANAVAPSVTLTWTAPVQDVDEESRITGYDVRYKPVTAREPSETYVGVCTHGVVS